MASGSIFRRPSVFLALGLCFIGGVVTLVGRLATGPPVEPKRVTLGGESGTKAYPAFSPDGARVAYSARDVSKVEAYHLFTRAISGGAPQKLTEGDASDIGPAWSPDGKSIAFLRIESDSAECMVIPSGGGAERKIADCAFLSGEADPPPAVSWTRDGKSLAVVGGGGKQLTAVFLAPLEGGDMRRLTNPPEGSGGDSTPAVSPDGATLAFVRNASTDAADVYLCDISGDHPRRLTFDGRTIRGIAWTPDGRDIVYSANRLAGLRLWRLPAYGGSPRELQIAGRRAQYPAVARRGGRLAYTDSNSVTAVWRAALAPGANDDRPLIRSSGGESAPSYSPDGKKIANVSGQSGADEIWVGDADGGNREQITHLAGPDLSMPRWSPDGKTLLFTADGDRGQEVYTIPFSGGSPKRVLMSGTEASWSHDGKSIYFATRNQIWKASANGGSPQALEPETFGLWPQESPDGKYIYYRGRRVLARMPVGGGKEEQVAAPERGPVLGMQVTRKGVYYSQLMLMTRGLELSFYDFSTQDSKVLLSMKNVQFSRRVSFSVSPDGKYVLYPRTDQSQTDLILVENFR